MVANKLNLDARQLRQSQQLSPAKALVRLRQPDKIFRHGGS